MMTVKYGKGGAAIAAAILAAQVLATETLWPGFASRAFAATAVSIKTHIVEIGVDVDDALKSYPGLFDNCVAESKTYASAMRAQAEKAHHDDPASFRDGTAWTYDRGYELRSAVGRTISIVRSDDTFEGGAHPNHMVDTILWDTQAQKRIAIRPFFTETADNGPTMNALANEAKLAVAMLKIAGGIPGGSDDTLRADITPAQYLRQDTFINDGIKPALLKLGPVTLAPSTEAGKSSGLTSLWALCRRPLCGRRLYGLRAVDGLPAISVAGRRGAFRRHAAEERRRQMVIPQDFSFEHDLFRPSFARRSGLREGGKPVSILGSSPRAGFFGIML